MYKKLREEENEHDCDLRNWPVVDMKTWVWDGTYCIKRFQVTGGWPKDLDQLNEDRHFTVGDYTFDMDFIEVGRHTGEGDNNIEFAITGWKYSMSQGCDEVRSTRDIWLRDPDGNPHMVYARVHDEF